MTRNAVGFYWTLPVPWAGFVRLPADADEAAKRSRTIRYQRDLTRRFAVEHGFDLVHEEAFLEVEPDRGSEVIIHTLEKLRTICHEHDALLLYVDFADVHMWRAHMQLNSWLRSGPAKSLGIAADKIRIDGELFDPFAHFKNWRTMSYAWSEGKEARIQKALARAGELRDKQQLSFAKLAGRLNAEGLLSATGKPWTEDSLRKQMKMRSWLVL
jgi:hypothetical protein